MKTLTNVPPSPWQSVHAACETAAKRFPRLADIQNGLDLALSIEHGNATVNWQKEQYALYTRPMLRKVVGDSLLGLNAEGQFDETKVRALLARVRALLKKGQAIYSRYRATEMVPTKWHLTGVLIGGHITPLSDIKADGLKYVSFYANGIERLGIESKGTIQGDRNLERAQKWLTKVGYLVQPFTQGDKPILVIDMPRRAPVADRLEKQSQQFLALPDPWALPLDHAKEQIPGTRVVGERLAQAEEQFIILVMDAGFSREEAQTIFAVYRKQKCIRREGVNRWVVKHGGYWERDALRRALALGTTVQPTLADEASTSAA